jgi:caa(3)-type oxidase subunit IV
MALVILSVVASWTLPRSAALLLIFAVALVKAVLVALYYMHLKYEKWQLATLLIVPLLLVIGLAVTLYPDLVFRHYP